MTSTSELRGTVVHILGGICSVCMTNDFRSLQIDHRYEDGWYDRGIRFSSATTFLKYYIENPDEAREDLKLFCYPFHKTRKHNKHQRYLAL
jgi:hypothetical protein